MLVGLRLLRLDLLTPFFGLFVALLFRFLTPFFGLFLALAFFLFIGFFGVVLWCFRVRGL